jgi:hypothetical protein
VATFDYNPITGQLDLVGSGASYINGVVADPTALPVTLGTPPLDSVYLAKAGSGVWLINRRPAGLYVRVANNGVAADWTYLGAFPEVNADANWELYNSTDPTKELKFDLSSITTGTTRTLTAPNASGRIQIEGQPIGNTTPAAGTFTTLTANNGTLTASAPVLDLAQTWDASGTTFTGLNLALTNTASASASSYFNISLDGNEAFSIRRGESTVSATLIRCGGTGGLTWTARTRTGGGVGLNFQHTLGIGASLEFLATASGTTGGDVALVRDGDGALGQRRGANAQTFNIYSTFTSATNHERGFLKWSSNVFQIGTEKGSGGGTARALALQTDGTTRMTVGTDGFVGIGVTAERPLHIQGSAAFGRMDRQGANGPAWLMIRMATGTTVSSSWLFGPATGVASVANDDFAIIDYGTSTSGTSGTQRLTIAKSDGQLTVNGNLNLSTKDLVTDTTTGTKIGTGTTQKLGFFNATPAVQPAAVADATDAASTQARLNDLLARLRTIGIIAT